MMKDMSDVKSQDDEVLEDIKEEQPIKIIIEEPQIVISKITKEEPKIAKPIKPVEEQVPSTKYRKSQEFEESTIKPEKSLIRVFDPVNKEGIKNYTLYTVESNLINKGQHVQKRYRDFDFIRQKLMSQWPGIFIPGIPPKKLVGNLDSNFVETRCLLLDAFCKKLIERPYLLNSKEFIIFLNSVEPEKEIDSSSISYEEIMIRFKNEFTNYVPENVEPNLEDSLIKINEFQAKILNKALITIRNFKEVTRFSYEKKAQEIHNYQMLLSTFTDYEKQVLNEYTSESDLIFYNIKNVEICKNMIKLKDHLQNPLKDLLYWTQEEEIELEAMIEAIGALNNLVNIKKAIQDKKSETETTITTLQSGRRSFKTLFSMKSKKDDLSDQENLKGKYEIEIKSIEHIIKLAVVMMHKTIEIFKVERLSKYHKNLTLLAEAQRRNSEIVSELWTNVQVDLKQKNQGSS